MSKAGFLRWRFAGGEAMVDRERVEVVVEGLRGFADVEGGR